jgi:hypothetical protein
MMVALLLYECALGERAHPDRELVQRHGPMMRVTGATRGAQ